MKRAVQATVLIMALVSVCLWLFSDSMTRLKLYISGGTAEQTSIEWIDGQVLSSTKVTVVNAAMLKELDKLPGFDALCVSGIGISQPEIDTIEALAELLELHIEDCELADDVCLELPACQEITFERCFASDKANGRIVINSRLDKLSIINAGSTDPNIVIKDHIRKLSCVKSYSSAKQLARWSNSGYVSTLEVVGQDVDVSAFANSTCRQINLHDCRLARSEQDSELDLPVKSLEIVGCDVGTELSKIRLPFVSLLDLSRSTGKGADLLYLIENSPNVEMLYLTGTDFGNELIDALKKLKNLSLLNVKNTRITDEALDAFLASQPQIKLSLTEGD